MTGICFLRKSITVSFAKDVSRVVAKRHAFGSTYLI